MNYYRLFYPVYKREIRKMCLACQNFVQKREKILDLGCGSGIVAKAFQDFFQAEVIGVDVKDQRIFHIPFEIINGKDLPFPEKSFDVVLISYVLHHTKDPEALLKEAKRVSRGRVVVFEDLPEGFFSKLICKFHSISYSKLFGFFNFSSFKSEKDWKKIFEEIGLNVIFKKIINNFPAKKELFVLSV